MAFPMQSPRGAVIGKFCSYLACIQWGEVPCVLCSPRRETLRYLPLLMQICTRFRRRSAMVKSDVSGPKGLTLHLPVLS